MSTLKQSVVYLPVFNEVYKLAFSHLKAAKVLLKCGISLMLGILFLTGCSNTPNYVNQSTQSIPLASPVDLTNQSKVKSRLLSQYRDWKGTPYRYGGTSH